MIKNLFATICTFAFLLFLSQTAHGCFCSYASAKDTFSSSDVVFVGKVSKIMTVKEASVGAVLKESGTLKINKTRRWEKYIANVQSVTLEVIEPLKGMTEKTFVLFTAIYNGGGSCGVPFKVGESYLVFAGKTQPMLSKEDAAKPKENWTFEMRLESKADKFNEQLPLYETNICARTDRLRFMKEELEEIRSFIKNGVEKETKTYSPFMPPLSQFIN